MVGGVRNCRIGRESGGWGEKLKDRERKWWVGV